MRRCVLILVLVGMAGCNPLRKADAPLQAVRTDAGVIVPIEIRNGSLRVPESIPAGEVILQIHNQDKASHGFQIAGADIDFGVPRIEPGARRRVQATLPAGAYRVTCTAGPDDKRPMRREVTVR